MQVFEALARGMSMRGNSTVRSYITYTPLGYTERSSGAFQAGSLTVCASTSGRRIVISRTGRPRTEEITC